MTTQPLPLIDAGDRGDPASAEGAIERFIRAFNQFEAEQDLFARCVDEDGFAWWDLARYTVQFSLCAEKGIYGQRLSTPHRWSSRFASAAARSGQLARDLPVLLKGTFGEVTHLYIFGRTTPILVDDLQRNAPHCLVVSNGEHTNLQWKHIGKRSIEYLAAFGARFLQSPEPVAQEAVRLDALLKEQFDSRLDFCAMIRGKYIRHRTDKAIWSRLIERLPRLEEVDFVNDDTLRTLVALANSRGVKTREFQHGYMGRSHVAYNYPALEAVPPTLPSEALVHRDSGDITLPVTIRRVEIPAAGAGDSRRDIDVLIGGSPTRNREAQAIAGALVGRGYKVGIKLHPAQTLEASGMRQLFAPSQLEIFAQGDDFCELARRSKIYVPANPTSTTAYEAVENGADLIVIDYGGEKLTTILDSITAARVSAPEDLEAAVAPMLAGA